MEIYHNILREYGEDPQSAMPPPSGPPPGMPPAGAAPSGPPPVPEPEEKQNNVIEFPHQNFTLSIMNSGKKLVFTPQQHGVITTQMKSYVDMIEKNFLILKTKNLGGGAFELQVDPREDFDAVVDFISGQIDREREL